MIKIKIDDKDFKAALVKFSKDLNKDVGDSIVEMAQIGARQLAIRSQPYGIDEKAENTSIKLVYKDIGKAYHTIGRTYKEIITNNPKFAIPFLKAVNNNDYVLAEHYADKAIEYNGVANSDDGSFLEASRNGSKQHVGKISPRSIADRSSIDRIKELKIKTIGLAKAGWLNAGAAIGSKSRVPKWLRKGLALGTGTVIKNGVLTVVNLINNVRYAESVITESAISAAMNNAYRNQIKKLVMQINNLTKKF